MKLNVLSYYDSIFIEMEKSCIEKETPYLLYHGKRYIEVHTFFQEYFGIAITHPKLVKDALQITTQGRVFAETLTAMGSAVFVEAVNNTLVINIPVSHGI